MDTPETAISRLLATMLSPLSGEDPLNLPTHGLACTPRNAPQ